MKKPHEDPGHGKAAGAAIPKVEVEPNAKAPATTSGVEIPLDYSQAQTPGSNVAKPKK